MKEAEPATAVQVLGGNGGGSKSSIEARVTHGQ